jgi:hypothetical protein
MDGIKEIPKDKLKIIQQATQLLTEHFENCAIFVNYHEKETTFRGEYLSGNYFSLQHHIEGWVEGDFDEDKDDGDEENSFA